MDYAEVLQRRQWIIDGKDNLLSRLHQRQRVSINDQRHRLVELLHMPRYPGAPNQRPPGTTTQCFAHKLMPIDVLAWQCHKQIANGHLAGVDCHCGKRRLIM